MAETVRIAELSIDTSSLVTSLKDTKANLDELTATKKRLRAQNDTSSEAFLRNEAAIKSARSEYNRGVKALSAVTDASSRLDTALK